MSKYGKVRGRIVEVFGNQEQFAKAVSTTPQTITNKLNGKSTFSQKDIYMWSEALNISKEEIGNYFFAN